MRKWYILSLLKTCGRKNVCHMGKETKISEEVKCSSFLDIIGKKKKAKFKLALIFNFYIYGSKHVFTHFTAIQQHFEISL